ncbi:unnamed protein product [Arctia plantaginis]|uniref:Uncharacterized protein n=1 Tax=Arctia plantaginis TaxID=874455 RepID=A0A8S1BLU3_ARCPL|nr:unnamed protein product [Arctia plantaginis]
MFIFIYYKTKKRSKKPVATKCSKITIWVCERAAAFPRARRPALNDLANRLPPLATTTKHTINTDRLTVNE